MKKEKRCTKCGKVYLLGVRNFSPHQNTQDGFQSICRFCKRQTDRIYSRRYRKENQVWKAESNFLYRNGLKGMPRLFPIKNTPHLENEMCSSENL